MIIEIQPHESDANTDDIVLLAELFNWSVRQEEDTWYVQDTLGHDLLSTKNPNAFEFDFVDLIDWSKNEYYYLGILTIKRKVKEILKQSKTKKDLVKKLKELVSNDKTARKG